jgi:hypothetical protein
MADLLMLVIFLAFFLLSLGFIELLERLRNLSR